MNIKLKNELSETIYLGCKTDGVDYEKQRKIHFKEGD